MGPNSTSPKEFAVKIAATSCADPLDHPDQKVWRSIAQAAPDHLLLLGDQIYMDYGAGKNPGNGKPAEYPDVQFAAHMYLRYASQWQVMRNSGLWQVSGMKVHGIWDDHDFAWNNSFGAGAPVPSLRAKYQAVPASKQQISRHLFRLFFSSLRKPVFPANTLLTQEAIALLHEDLSMPVFFSEMLAPDQRRGLVELAPDLRLLLTDGRSFRTAQGVPDDERTMLGSAQTDWLHANIKAGGITLIASGCTLNYSPEAWSAYGDYDRLRARLKEQADARVLVFSGDIHNTDLRTNHGPGLIEMVASGAARPLGNLFRPDRGNYVLCEVTQSTIQINSFEGEAPDHIRERSATIDRASWRALD